jgi:hypothetical protein
MTINLYAFTCGTVTGEFAHLMEGGEGDITVPNTPKGGHFTTLGYTPIASTTRLDGSVSGSPGFSVSAFGPAKKSAHGSKRSTDIPARST